MKKLLIVALMLLILPRAHAQDGLLGQWTEPGGSTIAIYSCASGVCAKLIALSRHVHASTDVQNPDAALRQRPLCGLQIGSGFHPNGPNAADGGQLYDPKSGKTYSGSMASSGDTLKLRGYVGFKLFGRTELWTRARAGVASCQI